MTTEKHVHYFWDGCEGDSLTITPATAPTSPLAAEPAPVQGADPTGPQTAADGELTLLREDNEMAEVLLRIARRNANRWEQKHNTQRERADKAVALADYLFAHIAHARDAMEITDESSTREFEDVRARLAELRAGTEEAQSNG